MSSGVYRLVDPATGAVFIGYGRDYLTTGIVEARRLHSLSRLSTPDVEVQLLEECPPDQLSARKLHHLRLARAAGEVVNQRYGKLPRPKVGKQRSKKVTPEVRTEIMASKLPLKRQLWLSRPYISLVRSGKR